MDIKEAFTVFRPSQKQVMAKANILKRMHEMGIATIEHMPIDRLCDMAGTRSLKTWLQDGAFASWLYDMDVEKVKVRAYLELAIDGLYDILTDPDMGPKGTVSAKDKLAAAKMILELNNAFPSRTAKEDKYLDDELNKLDDEETKRRIEALQKQLKLGVVVNGTEEE